MVGVVAVLGTVIATFGIAIRNGGYSKTAAKAATEANKAVNNVGPGEHRLYDLIDQIAQKQAEFDVRWGNLPAGLDNSVSLAETIHDIHRTIHSMQTDLRNHIDRENR